MSEKEILQRIQSENVEFIDLQFGDMFGMLNHTTFIAKNFEESHFKNGIPFDGSSIRSWKSIDKSDMVFLPDIESAFIDPFRTRKTMVFFGDIIEPRTGEMYSRSPRTIIHNALNYLKSLGIGDEIFFGPEPEFFIFDSVNIRNTSNVSYYEVDSVEGPWNSDAGNDNLGHLIKHKMGYFPASPQDTMVDLRNDITTHMQEMGMHVYLHHHEVGTAQGEIGFRYGTGVTAGDSVHKYKYAVKNTAHAYGKSATFMPKPMAGDNGSGMHVHSSIWKGGNNIFAGDEYANLSDTAIYAIGGLLRHGRSIQVFTNPTGNSYRRLVPGYEAPVKLAYSATNRSAAVRIPYVIGSKARRIEFRCGDSSGSPYLNFAALTMAMIDGIRNKIHPGDPLDKNIYDLPAQEAAKISSTSTGLDMAISELKNDMEFLVAGDVFSEDLIDAYLDYKVAEEIEPLKVQPTPLEYELYYDI